MAIKLVNSALETLFIIIIIIILKLDWIEIYL